MDVARQLTEREREVIRLAGQGLTVKETALRMHITPSTVRMHRRNAFFKLGVDKIAAAVRRLDELDRHPWRDW